MLIVLDNCEHVIDPVAELVDVALSYGGAWRIIATSREPLGLRDEHLVPVEPLGAAAADLFVDRARRLEPRAAWDPADELIVDLCARLDGLPLAVELAAGQVRRWSLAELSRRIVDPAHHLTVTAARGQPRHQTMTAAIEWSYALLEPPEQRLLRHLAVFPARFDLAAADSLRPLLGDIEIDRVLAALVDKSLVVREADSSSYRVLETIRAFALERLDECGERDGCLRVPPPVGGGVGERGQPARPLDVRRGSPPASWPTRPISAKRSGRASTEVSSTTPLSSPSPAHTSGATPSAAWRATGGSTPSPATTSRPTTRPGSRCCVPTSPRATATS